MNLNRLPSNLESKSNDIDPHVMDSSPPLPAVDRDHQSGSINALGSTRDGDKAHQSRETAQVSDDSGGASPSKGPRPSPGIKPSDENDLRQPYLAATAANIPTGEGKHDGVPHAIESNESDSPSDTTPALSHPPGQSEPHSPSGNLKSKEIIDPAHQSKERARSSSHHEDIGPFKKQRTRESSPGKDQDDVEPPVTDSTELDLPSNAAPALSHPSREYEPQSHPEQPEMASQSPERLEATQLAPSSDSSFVPDDAHLNGSIESSHQPNERIHLLSHYEDISPFKKQRTVQTSQPSDNDMEKPFPTTVWMNSPLEGGRGKVEPHPVTDSKDSDMPITAMPPAGDTGPSVETTSPADKDDGTIQSHPALMIDKGGKQLQVSYNQGTPETTSDLPQGKSSMASRMRKISLSPRQKNTILPTPDQMIALHLNREIMAPAINIDEGMKEPLVSSTREPPRKSIVKTEESVDESQSHSAMALVEQAQIEISKRTFWLTHKIRVKEEPYEIEQTEQQPRGKWRSRKPDYLSRVEEPSTRLRRRIDRIAATLSGARSFHEFSQQKNVRTGDPSNEGSEGSRDLWVTHPQKKSLSDIMESFRLLIRGSYYVMKVTLKGLYDMGVMRVPGENEYFDGSSQKPSIQTEEIPLLKQRAIEYLSLPQSSQNPLKESIHFLGIFYKNGQPEVWRTIGNNDQEFWRFMKNQCKQFEERIERGKQISQELGPDRDILQLSGVKQILLDPPIRLTNLFKRYLLKKEYGFAYMERKPLYLIEKMYEIRKKTQHRVQETIPNEDLPFYMSRHWDLKRKTIRFNIGLILKYKPKSDTKSELVDKMQTILLPAHRFFKAIYHSEFRSELPPESYNSMFCDWTTNVIGGRGATLPIVGYIYRDSPEMKIESYTDIQLLLIDHLVKQKNTKQLLTAGISLLAFWFREQKPQDWKRRFKADSGAFLNL
ncbi:hypothetical protein KEM48_002962 [Puccinia striiformis f. sp. tritici PST-130]|nr:hypothetical protein KEM48_002962 [Puccinia striiformis f. sp. tritici PST-130]